MYMYSFVNNITTNKPKTANLFTRPMITNTTLGVKVKTNQLPTRFNSMIDKVVNGATKCGSCGH